MKLVHCSDRIAAAVAVVLGCLLWPLALQTTSAAEREFLVMLGAPKGTVSGMPNPDDIEDVYFDTVKDDVHSFAEFWHEVSYGDLTIRGDVLGWTLLPWPIAATGHTGEQERFEMPETMAFVALPGQPRPPGLVDGVWTPGERFRDLRGYSGEEPDGIWNDGEPLIRDSDGDGCYQEPEEFEDWSGNGTRDTDIPEPFTDENTNGQYDPGEEFEDWNENGAWDASVDEPFDDADADGVWDNDAYEDTNGNDQWDPAELFEDFMIRWDAGAEAWVQVDYDYILANYPGDVDGLWARTGNGTYDGPDFWIESGNTTKMWQHGVVGLLTGEPIAPGGGG